MAFPPRPARPDPPPAPTSDREWPLGAPGDPRARTRRGSTWARALWIVVGIALVASAAFSIGELRGARHHVPNGGNSVVASSPLAGLSTSGLQNLESQVSQAAAVAQAASGSGASADLSQLEQQLGISPSASTSDQAAQLQAELNAINACLSSSSSAPSTGC